MIYYANKELDGAHKNYIITEQELFVVVYDFEKFRVYLLRTKVLFHSNHAAF